MAKGTGAGLLERARKHVGEQYVNRQVPKDDPDWAGPWDCAEFVSWLVYQEAGVPYGWTDNKASPATADAYTGAWRRDAREIGLLVPVEQAAATVGGVLLRYPPEPGKMGHIVVCDGKGGTVEAMGVKYGVVAGTVQGRRWDTGVLIPGIAYGGATASIPVAPPTELYALNMPNMNAAVVTEIQKALKAKGFDPGGVDGDFGRKTMQAVAAFQESVGLIVDGEVGKATATSLGVNLVGAAAGVAETVAKGIAAKGIMATNPLLAIATALLPDIAKAIAGDKTGVVAGEVSRAVTEASGTTDPAASKTRIEADPVAAAQLQLKLAEISLAQEDRRQKAYADALRAQSEADAKPSAAEIELRKSDNENTENARTKAIEWAKLGGPMAYGPIVVSSVIVIGFFVVLTLLIGGQLADLRPDAAQIINIVIGALVAAFSTVVSFWLGSSSGSRTKDVANVGLQIAQAEQNKEALKAQTDFVEKVSDRAASHVEAIKAPPPAAPVPKHSNFIRCIDTVLLKEGGFVDHPRDPGGATNFGITIGTLREWRGADAKDGNEVVTVDDVRKLTIEEAREIYRSRYWNAMRCDDLPTGVDLMVFDFGVNAGPSRAAKILQKAVGAESDGSIGPATLGATRASQPSDIITDFARKRIEFYKGLPTWDTFGKGWTNRTDTVRDAALAMAAEAKRTP